MSIIQFEKNDTFLKKLINAIKPYNIIVLNYNKIIKNNSVNILA